MKKIIKIFKSCKIGVLDDKGLTIVELIIALTISLLVVAAAGFILLTQSGVIRLSRSVSTEQQRLNTAFNTVRYSLRMAGFDYGQSYYIQAGSLPPVQIVQASYPTNPYEVLISYSAVVNGTNPCTITPVANGNSASSEYDLGQYCNANNFYIGQILNITNPVPLNNQPLPTPPITLCVTQVQLPPAGTYGRIQINPGKGGVCQTNPIPPKSIGGGSVSSINQILFYWGNTAYNFNTPFNIPGNLYECMVSPPVIEPPSGTYSPFACAANTTIMLSDYINGFNISPLNSPNNALSYDIQSNNNGNGFVFNFSNGQTSPVSSANPPILLLSVTGESNVALSDSPAYSVHVPYNSNANGANAKGNAGQVVGNNVLKTLNSGVFLRNVYYGS